MGEASKEGEPSGIAPLGAGSTQSAVSPADAGLNRGHQQLDRDDPWLHDFYKECGREVTLAYTTLNQMKNWAIVVQAAIIAAVVSFSRNAPNEGWSAFARPEFALVVGASLAYLFTLRFFIRAILCYINLLRWNQLQRAVVNAVLLPHPLSRSGGVTAEQHWEALRSDIDLYYHRWLSPIPRKKQVLSNLKLGFGLLLTLPVFFTAWGTVLLWDLPLARGIAFFVLGGTLIEVIDFLMSGFFNDPNAADRKAARKNPLEESPTTYVVAWVVNLLGAGAIAAWPVIRRGLEQLCMVAAT